MQHVTIKRNGAPTTLPLKLKLQIEIAELVTIDSHELERQMDSYLGWTLRDIGLGGGTPEQVKVCEQYIRDFLCDYPSASFVEKQISTNFQPHEEPVCMQYETHADLADSLGIIYQLMYFHYLLGRNKGVKGSFPNWCCGISARNLTIALWQAGIVAAVSTYNSTYDHSYVVIPFRFAKTKQKGVILADPTSNQLHFDPSEQTRNRLLILPSEAWEYRTDWKQGRNLYPELVQASTCYGYQNHTYSEYMQTAFQTPAIVTT